MDLLSALKISSGGMNVQRTRMTAISSNLANVNTTRTPEGGPYKRKDVVVAAEPMTDSFGRVMENELAQAKVVGIKEDQTPPRMVYDPSHPDANADGYVAMPNVNVMEQMVDMITAQRSYEANAAVVTATKSMANRAIELGSSR